MRFLLIILLFLISLPCSFAEESENAAQEDVSKTKEAEIEAANEAKKETVKEAQKEAESEKLISPIGAVVRSAIFPGWGQIYSRSYIRSGLIVLSIGGSAVGALLAERSFRSRYNAYATLANLEPDNEAGVLASYEHANQRYKLRMFFLYSGVGIWLYSVIDSYVSANFYNATTQIRSIQQDAELMEDKLRIQVGAAPSHLYLGIVKTF